MARGARGKYREWITEDGLLMIESWARDGLVDADIARNIGINPSTLYEWQNKYPEIAKALKRGKAPVDMKVENALLKRALGYEYEEKRIEVDALGEEKRIGIKRYAAPDVTAQIFWLKNRKPAQWRDRQVIDAADEGKLAALIDGLKTPKESGKKGGEKPSSTRRNSSS